MPFTFLKKLFQRHNPFQVEIIKSEYNRTLLMLSALALMLVVAVFNGWFLRDSVFSFPGGQKSFYGIVLWISGMLVFEAAVLWRINWFRRRNLRLPTLFLYVYSILEITFPSLLMYYEIFVLKYVLFLDAPLFIFYFLILFLSALHINAMLTFVIALTAATQYTLIIWFLFQDEAMKPDLPDSVYYVYSLMIVITGLVASFIADQFRTRILSFLSLLMRQRTLETRFGQHVSTEVARALEEQGDKARDFKATVMVIDIRDFSAYAEKHTPGQILAYQNDVFEPMISIINRHHGIVNQILGDGLMATFGAPVPHPEHSAQAVSAAIAILHAIRGLNEAKAIPHTRIGIGLHSGEVITGNIGTENRKQYSFSGSAVIIAFRVEQLNKEFGTQLLITESVRQQISDDVVLRHLGEKTLKGFNDTVAIYEAGPLHTTVRS